MKSKKLPNCNLYITGSGLDANGNKVVKLKFVNSRGFSIQTNGNLPNTGRILRGLKTLKDMSEVTEANYVKIANEVCSYIKNHGSETQKAKLRIQK